MSLHVIVRADGCELSADEDRRLRRSLATLERRLAHRPDPVATVDLKCSPAQRRAVVSLRIKLGPLGPHLVSHQSAETADRAARLAVQDVKRQLERMTATQRGEPSFGVPSRRPERPRRPLRAAAPAPGGRTGEPSA